MDAFLDSILPPCLDEYLTLLSVEASPLSVDVAGGRDEDMDVGRTPPRGNTGLKITVGSPRLGAR